jgi:hypothetical protein
MGRDSADHAVLDAIKIELQDVSKITSEHEKEITEFCLDRMRNSPDERVRLGAVKQLQEMKIKRLELMLKMEEYEKPATQKSELTVNFPTAIQITYPQKDKSNG